MDRVILTLVVSAVGAIALAGCRAPEPAAVIYGMALLIVAVLEFASYDDDAVE